MLKSYLSLLVALAVVLVGVGCHGPKATQEGQSTSVAAGHHGFPGGCTVFSGGKTSAFFKFDSKGVMFSRQSVPVEGAYSAYRLENGNYLLGASTGVYEVTEAGKIVFHYEDDCPRNSHTWAFRLPSRGTPRRLPSSLNSSRVGRWSA